MEIIFNTLPRKMHRPLDPFYYHFLSIYVTWCYRSADAYLWSFVLKTFPDSYLENIL